jgi:undecaprenyl phosphate N,N'-diacetylbacillosamine 1-phosphate transferase
MYTALTKRILDFIAALCGLILFFPLITIVAIVLAFFYRGNPFFVQKRAGYKGRIFSIWKFKTMYETREDGVLLPDSVRLHPFGRVMRRLSVDELPQLFNVLAGDMSIVGPRPLLPEYLPYYSDEQMRRHELRPGITGWAQVNGRNTVKFSMRFSYDVWYVNHVSFILDGRIVWMTMLNLFRRTDKTKLNYLEEIDDLDLGRDLPDNYRKRPHKHSVN